MRQRDVTLVVYDLDMTPDDLASHLGISPKRLRAWLRLSRPRSPAEHGARWNIDGSTIEAARVHFFSTGSEAIRTPRSDRSSPHRTRDHSDEAYVIDLCDEILGEHGNRQHRFDWLLGDPNADGRRARLPVDAWYRAANIIVEYRERQHHEPVPIMGARPTISGVDRGQQRRRYDQRREAEIPAHGIRLVIIRPGHLDSDTRGRLRRRDRERDLAAMRRMLDV